jgi:hypothetical protein
MLPAKQSLEGSQENTANAISQILPANLILSSSRNTKSASKICLQTNALEAQEEVPNPSPKILPGSNT